VEVKRPALGTDVRTNPSLAYKQRREAQTKARCRLPDVIQTVELQEGASLMITSS
jgi:hypothetical protein